MQFVVADFDTGTRTSFLNWARKKVLHDRAIHVGFADTEGCFIAFESVTRGVGILGLRDRAKLPLIQTISRPWLAATAPPEFKDCLARATIRRHPIACMLSRRSKSSRYGFVIDEEALSLTWHDFFPHEAKPSAEHARSHDALCHL